MGDGGMPSGDFQISFVQSATSGDIGVRELTITACLHIGMIIIIYKYIYIHFCFLRTLLPGCRFCGMYSLDILTHK